MCLVRNIYNIQQSNKIKNKYINKLVFKKNTTKYWTFLLIYVKNEKWKLKWNWVILYTTSLLSIYKKLWHTKLFGKLNKIFEKKSKLCAKF